VTRPKTIADLRAYVKHKGLDINFTYCLFAKDVHKENHRIHIRAPAGECRVHIYGATREDVVRNVYAYFKGFTFTPSEAVFRRKWKMFCKDPEKYPCPELS